MTVYSRDSVTMSEKAENLDVASDSAISLSKDDYQKLLRTISSQNQKIQALKNLHQLIQSKDNELKSVREKSQNLQTALDRAEARLVNQIRLAAVSKGPSCLSTLEADSATFEKVTAENRQADGRLILPTSDIEMDGECAVEQTSRFLEGPCVSSKPLPSPALNDKSRTFFKSSALLVQHNDTDSDKNGALQSMPLKITSVKPVKSEDTSVSLGGATRGGSLASSTALKSFGGNGGVSKDLLDKLMHQNARLRKVIKDILEQRETTIESHLEKQEAQDVVAQLREELRLSKQQNEKFKQIINAKDNDDFLKKYAELNENFQKAKKTVAMLQVMVDTYGKEYEKLQEENKVLKDQLSASVKVNETKVPTTDKASDEGIGCCSKQPPPQKQKHGEASDRLKATESECENLRTHCQQLQETLVHYEKENVKVEHLGKQCAMLESEKQLLQSQVAVFQEDFANEHKEYIGKQQHYEAMLAKHQDWIRQLVTEGQKSRSGLEEEKGRRLAAESACRNIQEQFRKYIIESRSSSGPCRNVESNTATAPMLFDLQVDNAPETSSADQDRGFSARNEEVGGMLVCPRCEREFDRRDEQKFREHTARCTDD